MRRFSSKINKKGKHVEERSNSAFVGGWTPASFSWREVMNVQVCGFQRSITFSGLHCLPMPILRDTGLSMLLSCNRITHSFSMVSLYQVQVWESGHVCQDFPHSKPPDSNLTLRFDIAAKPRGWCQDCETLRLVCIAYFSCQVRAGVASCIQRSKTINERVFISLWFRFNLWYANNVQLKLSYIVGTCKETVAGCWLQGQKHMSQTYILLSLGSTLTKPQYFIIWM